MATTVASLLNEGIKKSGIMGKMGRGAMALPGVQAGAAGVARAGRVAGRVGKVTPTGEVGAIVGATSGAPIAKAMMGMAGHIGASLPKLGKLAGPTQLMGLPKKLLSKGMGMMGINLSLSTLLRQSQLFTGILGALFQILGGFVDVILMPFMPFFTKAIQLLAAQIPKVREIAQKVFNWLNTNVFPVIKKGMDWIWGKIQPGLDWVTEHMPEIKDKIMEFVNSAGEVLTPVVDKAKEIVTDVWGWFKTHLLPTLEAAFFMILDMGKVAWAFLKDDAWPVLKNIFNNLKTIIEGVLKWLREDIYPLINQAWEWAVKELGGFILWLADNIVARLVKVIPMIQNIITQVVDILLNSLLKPLWKALEPILKWYLNLVMDNWTWIIKTINDKILPFIKGIIDDLMPHIQDLSDWFMVNLAPKITEFWEAFREFADALLDVLLPLIRLALKHVIFPLGAFLFKVLGTIVGWMFKVMSWILKGLTWLLKLPFTWRETLLNPILSAIDFGFDWIKKIFHFYTTFPDKLKIIILQSLAGFLQKVGGYGAIKTGKLFPDIPLDWLRDIGNKVMGVANNAVYDLDRRNAAMQAGLSTSSGGMRAKYGTSVTEININNYSERKVLDDTKKMQIMQGERRDVDNIQEQEDSLGSYDSIITSAGLV